MGLPTTLLFSELGAGGWHDELLELPPYSIPLFSCVFTSLRQQNIPRPCSSLSPVPKGGICGPLLRSS